MQAKWRYLKDRSTRGFRRVLNRRASANIVQPSGKLPVGRFHRTFVVAVGNDFDQTIPNAGTKARLGWCGGFEQIGIPYLLAATSDLARILPEIPRPIVWISGADYQSLDSDNFKALKDSRHVVWINTWFDGDADFYKANGFPNLSSPESLNRKVLSSEPDFVFTISPSSSFEYYENWSRRGAKLFSLPLACDDTLYRPDAPWCSEFSDVDIAFVGGYWPFKASQFDRYLRPYDSRLRVFGYSPWPYADYGGMIAENKEPSLYHQARLSPTINEPQAEMMGIDLNERVFKVLGSGGMTVTDVTPAYREWFTNDELLIPESVEHYHSLVQDVLRDEDLSRKYRQSGCEAIHSRHTYSHRARELLEHLGIDTNAR